MKRPNLRVIRKKGRRGNSGQWYRRYFQQNYRRKVLKPKEGGAYQSTRQTTKQTEPENFP